MTNDEARDLLIKVYDIAKHSPDLSTQNGAMLLNQDMEVIVCSYNHIPDGLATTDERLQRPLKYTYTEHAERAVVFVAARQGIKTDKAIMVCNWAACEDCARAIIMSGISELVTHGVPLKLSRQDWRDRVDVADGMLKEAGIKHTVYEDKLGLPEPIRFDGNLIMV